MKCEDRDPDLLLYGLGEIPLREGWRTAIHLPTCPRCRMRQAALLGACRHIAEELRPNPEDGGGSHPPASRNSLLSRLTRTGLAPYLLLVILGLLIVTVGIVGYSRMHSGGHAAAKDDGCTPGLNSDQCR